MQQHKVILPTGNSFSVQGLCLSIAEALEPTQNLVGSDCVLSWAHEANPSGILRSPSSADGVWPLKMSDDDREDLEKILPELPPLAYPLSEPAKNSFLSAYHHHSGCNKNYYPWLITEQFVEARKAQHAEIAERHREAILKACNDGWLHLLNSDQTPTAKPTSLGAYISRQMAIKYLTNCGFDVMVAVTPAAVEADADNAAKKDLSPQQPIISNLRWTPDKLKELQAYRATHTVKDTAQHFDICESRVYALLKKVARTHPAHAPFGSSPRKRKRTSRGVEKK